MPLFYAAKFYWAAGVLSAFLGSKQLRSELMNQGPNSGQKVPDWPRSKAPSPTKASTSSFSQSSTSPPSPLSFLKSSYLIRMTSYGKVLQPRAFIPIAERFHLLAEIDRQIIPTTIPYLIKHPDLSLAINLLGQTFADLTLADLIESSYKAANINPARIIFEITETGRHRLTALSVKRVTILWRSKRNPS
jgi:EAL domain